MSLLTPLHYLLLGGLGLVFILGAILALRSNSKFSIFATVILIIALLGTFLWNAINEHVYRVEITNVKQERYYQSEQILIKGVVRNVGKYPVANVAAIIRLSNAKSGNQAKASQFARPGAFAELFEGDNPDFKSQNVVEKHVVADYLSPGSSKTFRIMMDFPPHFTRASYDIEAEVD